MGNLIYKEEYNYIFSRKALSVRGASVVSAFVEAQILLLAKLFLKKHGVKYEPKQHQEFRQSLNILETNGVLSKQECKEIEGFWKERNKAIHGPFKGMTREEWGSQNNRVVETGRPIVKKLDQRIKPLENSV